MENLKPIRIYKASAGSGKTVTVAVEYITLLAVNPMAYQNILAVTFTNKATAEMKQRILSTLYGISHGLKGTEAYVDNIMKNVEVTVALRNLFGNHGIIARSRRRWKLEPYA